MNHRRHGCGDSIASGKTVTLTKFNTKCWGDTSTVYLTSADLPTIDKIGLVIPVTTSKIAVDDFCLKEIRFDN